MTVYSMQNDVAYADVRIDVIDFQHYHDDYIKKISLKQERRPNWTVSDNRDDSSDLKVSYGRIGTVKIPNTEVYAAVNYVPDNSKAMCLERMKGTAIYIMEK